MGLENIKLSEISQRKTDTIITYMWNLKSNTNEGIHKIETASLIEKATLLPKERGEGGETSVWYGINRYKLLYIK